MTQSEVLLSGGRFTIADYTQDKTALRLLNMHGTGFQSADRRFWIFVCWILLACSARASDLAISSLAQQGKHHELIREVQGRLDHGEAVSSFQLLMLGSAYYEVRQYRGALATADAMAKRIAESDSTYFGSDLSVYPQIFRASVALDLGAYEDTIKFASEARDRLKPNQFFYRIQVIQINNLLGVANAFLGRTDEAKKNLGRISEVNLFLSNLGPEKFIAMARIHMALKEFDKALEDITNRDSNVSSVLTLFYDPTFQTLPKYFIRCKSLFETRRLREAKEGFDQLLQHPQIAQYGGIYWLSLYDRGRIALQEGATGTAIELFRKAVEVIEQQRSSIDSEGGRIGFVGDKQAVYAHLVALLVTQGQAATAFDYVERSKARALVDLLAGKKDFAAQGIDAQKTRELLAQLDAADAATRPQEDAAKPGEGAATRGARNFVLARAQVQTSAPELATLVSVSTVPSEELRALLGAQDALVEYYYRDADLYAFVLDRERLLAVKLDGKGLNEEVKQLRDALEQVASDAWRARAASLYARLWQPLEGALGAAKSAVIVPHGALHYLPFALLLRPDGGFLVDRTGLRFLPSASVLKFLRPVTANKAAPMLIFGNPDLGNPALDLKFAESEARTVAALFADSRVFVRKEASETNFKKAGSVFTRIHFATHGKFEAGDPLSSGLYLAKDADNDGVLTVSELYSIRLNADLVTLSACETGLGKVANGDDVVGLTRGFLYAGSRSIVATLWSVADNATADLMKMFYANLATMNKEEALRRAQINTRTTYPHPFFWAAFQLTGRAD